MGQRGGFGQYGIVCAVMTALAGCAASGDGSGGSSENTITLTQETAEVGTAGVTSSGSDSFPTKATFDSASNTVTFDIDGVSTIVASLTATGAFSEYTGSDASGSITAAVGQLDHAVFGTWTYDRTTGTTTLSRFHAGSVTPEADTVSKTGTATYEGTFVGSLTTTTASAVEMHDVVGDSMLVVNFDTKAVSGDITNAQVLDASLTPFNDIDLAGTLTGSTFAGSATTVAVTTPNTRTFDAGRAGTMDGALYGPDAQEVAGAITIGEGSRILVGGFGGDCTVCP